jgi:hypothetical protein
MLLELVLENYVPLLSSNIHKVELNTEHMINLLISQNGTGKTSILKEANPNPPENGNYKNGRKYSKWRFGSNTYELDGYTGIGNGHSFKVNGGPELNTGGTFSVQKELVDAHFQMDSGMTKVLSGLRIVDRLSAMSPARRKDVLMQIYPNDTDYALGVYNRLKSERNELKAAIKNQIGRYTEENRKLSYINEAGIDQLEIRIKGIEEELKQSLLIRGGLENVDIDPALQSKVDTFNRLTDQLLANKLSGIIWTENEYLDAIETATRILNRHQEQAAILQGIISEHASYLDGLEEFLKDPDSFKEQAGHIKDDIASTLAQIEVINLGMQQYPVFNDPESPLERLEEVVIQFIGYVDRVTVASTQELTGNQYKGYLQQQEQAAVKIRALASDITDLTHELKHYDSAALIDCPDCNSQFKIGVTKADVDKKRMILEAHQGQLSKLEAAQEKLQVLIENDADWYVSMNQLFTFVRDNSHVRILPDLIKQFEVGKVHSRRLHNALELFQKRFDLQQHRDTLGKEESLLDARIALLDRNNVLDVAIYVSSTEQELRKENEKISFYRAKLDKLNNTLRSIQTYGSDVKRLDVLRHEILVGLESQGKFNLRGVVDQRISELTTDKENYLTSIIKSKSLTAVVQSISADIERMKRRLKIVDILMNGLCPNKGLIGKLMSDFITSICGNMNAVISQIWNTPLYIKPCAKENGDLTYKFPVVKGEKDGAPDVSDCSAGEADILDWVFRFVLLGYHKFPFPLVMDEVGPFLDEIKRGRFFNFVQEYTQGKDARQLFLVSHYFGQLGVFKDANIIALRYEGLTLPGEVNQHSTVM